MPALTEIFGDDACLQFGGGTLGHPWGNAVWVWKIQVNTWYIFILYLSSKDNLLSGKKHKGFCFFVLYPQKLAEYN